MAVRKEVSLSIPTFLFLLVLAIGLGSWFRVPNLATRPMHTDEAILGVKLGEFWNTGHFQYDPKDYHGPALHQVSWMWGHLAGWGTPENWTESELRMVAVLCGLALLLVTLLLADALGKIGTALALLFMAVSPLMVYFSRYFIMEMLLVLLVALSLGCFWRYSQGGTRLWLLLGGCAVGFQHATKETFILNVGAALCGWVAARVLVGSFQPRRGNSLSLGPSRLKGRPLRPWLWVLVPAVVISVGAYSGGFRDWAAVKDSLLTYGNYIGRSAGSGHEKPWHYYLTLIFWRKDTLLWTEALIGCLGLLGMVYSVTGQFRNTARQAFLVFLSVYTLALFTVYSLLSYKTPWCILSAHYGLILLAGVGGGVIWTWLTGRVARIAFNLLLAAGLWHLCQQTSISTGMNARLPYEADSRSPYVYSHPAPNFLALLKKVDEVRAQRGADTPVQVINRDSGWPLPWYWRRFKNAGYQTTVPETLDAPILVVEIDLLEAVTAKLQGRAFDSFGPYGLRPGVALMLLVVKDATPPPPPPAPVAPETPVPAPAPDAAPTGPVVPPEGTLSTPPPAFSPTLPPLPVQPVPVGPPVAPPP